MMQVSCEIFGIVSITHAVVFLVLGSASICRPVAEVIPLAVSLVHPFSVFSFSFQVREAVMNRFLIAKHHYVLSDVIVEEEVPSIG